MPPTVQAISQADRAILQSQRTRAIRAQVAPQITLIRGISAMPMQLVPSYVADALKRALDAYDRWTTEEADVCGR